MAKFNLNTRLTGASTSGTWTNGQCGGGGTSTAPFVISINGEVTIPDGTIEGDYSFNYAIPASNACTGTCTDIVLKVIVEPKAGADGTIAVGQGTTALQNFFAALAGAEGASTNTTVAWAETSPTNSGVSLAVPTAVDVSNVAVGTYTFTYTVSKEGCEDDVATLTLTVGACLSSGTINPAVSNTVCIN